MKKNMVIKLLGTLAIVAVLVALCIAPALADETTTTTTAAASPPGVPTLTSTGYLMKANMHLTDLTGTGSVTNYQYVDLLIATDVAGA